MEFGYGRVGVVCQPRDENRERELTWLSRGWAQDISEDGSELLFRGGFLRKTDGAPPVRLGDGEMQGLSADGRWAPRQAHRGLSERGSHRVSDEGWKAQGRSARRRRGHDSSRSFPGSASLRFASPTTASLTSTHTAVCRRRTCTSWRGSGRGGILGFVCLTDGLDGNFSRVSQRGVLRATRRVRSLFAASTAWGSRDSARSATVIQWPSRCMVW